MRKKVREYRPLSISARLWLAADRVSPPCVNQMMFEGNGILDPGTWHAAVQKASEANRGSRIVLKGMLGSCRWVDSGIDPMIREVDGGKWNGMTSEGAPFLLSSFPVRKGPNCEVLLIHGNPSRVAFRSHHAIMDGRGTMTWAEDVFRALRGEDPVGSEFIMTEDALLNVQWGKRKKPLPHQYIPLTGKTEGGDTSHVWRRRTIHGKYPKLLAQIMLLASREARHNGDGKVRIGIPVDLRYRRQGLRSTSNLANAIYIDIDENATVDQMAKEIERRVTNLYDGEITWEDKIGNYIPLWLLRKGVAIEGSRNQKSGRYRFSGFISNLGRVDAESFSCKDFETKSFYAIPLIASIVPFMMTLSGTHDRSELLLKTTANMATRGRLDTALDNILGGLKS